jgi:hypothetical protein
MLPDAVKAEQQPESAPSRRQPRKGLPRSYWVVGGLVLVIVAAVGLCQVSGLAAKLRPLPMPTATPVPTATLVPTAVPTATPVLTPTVTPVPVLAKGGKAVVKGTEAAKLKVRVGAGLNQETLLFVEDGTILALLDGPQASDGYNWWQVQTPDGLTGWVAGDWLEPVAP